MTDIPLPRLVYLRCANPENPVCLIIVSNGHEQCFPLKDAQVLRLVADGAKFLAERRAQAE